MAQEQFSIGSFSLQSGLSVRALRLYDEVGLLKPATVAKHNKYRYYQTEQLHLAQQIKFYRQYELPLDDIKIILENPRQAKATLRSHLKRLQNELDKQQALIGQLQQLLEKSS
jgi:MerR family transcriptional regulator, thiopeptide resistance regulator